jgi:hypothetical protein
MNEWQALGMHEFRELGDKVQHIESRMDLYLGLYELLQHAFATADTAFVRRVVEFMARGLRKSVLDEGWMHSTKHVLRAIMQSPSERAALFPHLSQSEFDEFRRVFPLFASESQIGELENEFRFRKVRRQS